MNKRILITGAAGFTGTHACSYFYENGYQVIGTSRNELASQKWEMAGCDLLDKSQILHVIKKYKPDYCLHLAGNNSVVHSWTNPMSAIESNVMGTLHLLEAIRQIKEECRTVIAGSALSGGNHPYAVSKLFQENLALEWSRLFQLPIIVAKPSNLIGPGQSAGIVSILARQIAELEKINVSKPITISHLENVREFLDVRDAVSAYDILLNKGSVNTTYEMGSSRLISLSDITNTYQTLTSIKLTFANSSSLPDCPPPLMNSKKLKDLNWQPKIPLKSSITDILTYFRNQV
ncbi:NAD-dependent epimerase/dehydratase family protein [Fictibacillus barbaricus]|uniref:GDP-4-dehydro-6-deoxy-D-mannose reductase n=1 Tax=Fictibacillus barbaricus TaxID=182136 RepID=A0ABU1TY16_9BACL|nr:NAD-dependent epimerase/dehydratase family protein [Fictibacillus barbaricus]MDR7072050.1 GDP-4-dehydro-6-deoxy-D-mannose reductase [Fictibacillus barbaricus]